MAFSYRYCLRKTFLLVRGFVSAHSLKDNLIFINIFNCDMILFELSFTCSLVRLFGDTFGLTETWDFVATHSCVISEL